MDDSKRATRQLARTFAERGDPDGWFEAFYSRAEGDVRKIYWADLKPNPLLVDWLEAHPAPAGRSAVTIGCGLGDDAELLAQRGYRVLAFDISPSAIDMCRQRHRGSGVAYEVADLFATPDAWHRRFDLVYECNTVQILSGTGRERAPHAIADLLAPGGALIVSCRSRDADCEADAFPVPLDRDEIDAFRRYGLQERQFLAYDDDQDPPVPHFFAVYRRPD